MKKGSKLLLLAMVISVLGLVLGSTYSWLTWSSSDNNIMNITIGNVVNYEYLVSNEINSVSLAPVVDYSDGEVLNFSLSKFKVDDTFINVYLFINHIDDELKNGAFRYVLVKDGVVYGDGSFEGVNDGERLYVLKNEVVGLDVSDYELYVYIDGEILNDNSMMNRKFNGFMNVEIMKGDDKSEN